jgi:hypothetical protein
MNYRRKAMRNSGIGSNNAYTSDSFSSELRKHLKHENYIIKSANL